jgi:hypothetical protein
LKGFVSRRRNLKAAEPCTKPIAMELGKSIRKNIPPIEQGKL